MKKGLFLLQKQNEVIKGENEFIGIISGGKFGSCLSSLKKILRFAQNDIRCCDRQ
jgi:hypothetical protein